MNKTYDLWLKSPNVSICQKARLRKYTNEQIDDVFGDKPLSFGTAGIRGIIGAGSSRMNKISIIRIATGYAVYIKNRKPTGTVNVIVGHDNRICSRSFSNLVARVFQKHGITVHQFRHNQLMATPIISYAIRTLKADGGIIITASHNPKEYNGFKAYDKNGCQILPLVAKEIESNMPSFESLLKKRIILPLRKTKTISNNILEKYNREAQTTIINKKFFEENEHNVPVVFTAHHGTASYRLPKLLKQMGFNIKVVKSQCYPNKRFKNSPCSNPEELKSFDASIVLANNLGAKVAIGVDPDADRMCVVVKHNDEWRQINGNEMGIIFTYYILANTHFIKTPYILASWVTNTLVDRIANKYDAKVYRTGTGFKWMGDMISKIGSKQSFALAFEEAIGALVNPINRDKDAFTATILALEIIHYFHKKNMDLVDVLTNEIFPEFGNWFGKTDSFVITSSKWEKDIADKFKLLESYSNNTFERLKIETVYWNEEGDCLDWILAKESWIRFRKSGTEPKFKIYYNLHGDSQEALEKTYKSLSNGFKKLLSI